MHSFTFAITGDSYVSWLLLDQVFIALFMLVFLTVIAFVAYRSRKPGSERRQARSLSARQKRWQARSLRTFQKWGIVVTPEELPRLNESLGRYWKPIMLFSALGAAGGLLLVPLALVVVSQLQPGVLAWLDYVDVDLWTAQILFSMTAGVLIGFLAGIWWVKRRPQNRLSYGDLAPRRLSNYRSPGFFWAEVLIVAFYAGMTWLTLTDLFDPSNLTFSSNNPSHLDQVLMIPIYPGLWILWGPPLLMLLVALATELGAARLAAAPRLLVVSDPQISRHLDDMARAQMIGALQAMALMTISFLGIAQAFLLGGNTEASTPTVMLIFTGFLELVCYPCVFLLNGRLGGRQTGWPWTVQVAA